MTDKTGRVAGKLALVTGAAQGLGAAHAKLLAREGARVLCTDLNGDGAGTTAKWINENIGADTAFAIAHDVTKPDDWEAAIAAARDQMGGLNVLVNNAGIGVPGNIETCDFADWQKCFSVNVDSMFHGVPEGAAADARPCARLDRQHFLHRRADRQRYDARLQRLQGGGVDAVQIDRPVLRQARHGHPLQFGASDLRRYADPRRHRTGAWTAMCWWGNWPAKSR